MIISIHAPQWGATQYPYWTNAPRRYFNPRTPVGCDVQQIGGGVGPRLISIHAPQWGATAHVPHRKPRGDNFNPRTPVGCDDVSATLFGVSGKFQSTHPSGVRRPRTTPPSPDNKISIHAPQWGATMYAAAGTINGSAFQSTHPGGVRPAAQELFRSVSGISIHAPQWGAT